MSSSRAVLIVCFALGAVAWLVFARGSHSESLPYVRSWPEALATARSARKPILLSFGGPWCPACAALETRVFSDARIRELAERFVCVKVDPRDPRDGGDAFRYKSTRYVPEVVFIDPEGEVISRLQSRDADGVVEEMRAALSRSGRGG